MTSEPATSLAVMPVKPERPPAPPELSKRIPPSEVAEAAVIVKMPVPETVPAVLILSELAAMAPVVAVLPAER